jgi:hypothetical protein
LESLGRSRISPGLTLFSLDSRLVLAWISLESLVWILTFQWVAELERRELFTGRSPGNLSSVDRSKSRGSSPFSAELSTVITTDGNYQSGLPTGGTIPSPGNWPSRVKNPNSLGGFDVEQTQRTAA